MSLLVKTTIACTLAFAVLVLATAAHVRAECPGPGVLDEALIIVMDAHPVLAEEREEYRAQTRDRDWDAYVRVGYAMQGTNDDAAGPNASIQVKIPLFSNAHKIAVQKARTAWRRAEDAVRRAFLTDMEKLCTRVATVRELENLLPFYRERMGFVEERVGEEVEDPAALWTQTEKVQQVMLDYRRERDALSALRQTISRQYGGDRWQDLFALLSR